MVITEDEQDDEDKILYNIIGTCTLSIDDIFKNLVMTNTPSY